MDLWADSSRGILALDAALTSVSAEIITAGRALAVSGSAKRDAVHALIFLAVVKKAQHRLQQGHA